MSVLDLKIDAHLDLNETRLRVRLDQLPDKIRAELYTTIQQLTNELLRKVIAREPRQTGRLQSLTQAYVDDNRIKQFLRGRVRVLRTRSHNTAAAAGALEYGSTGKKFAVRGYMSRGRSVHAYTRRGGITEMRFLRGPAAAMLPKARAELRAALRDMKL